MPTPQELLSAASCYLCQGVSEADALALGLLSSIAAGAPIPPPTPPEPPDALVAEWVARVVAAGGAVPSANTQTASDTFIKYLKANSIFTKVTVANLFVPDNLTAAYTPLLRGPGLASWTNAGPGTGVVDLTINGLKRNLAGASFLECGILPGAFMTLASGHGSVYISEGSKVGAQEEWGVSNGAGTNDFRMYGQFNDNLTYSYIFAQVRLLTGAISGGLLTGYICATRTAANRSDLCYASSGSAHASVANDVGVCAVAPDAVNTMKIFCSALGGVTQGFSEKRLSAVTFGTALTVAESALLFNAIQTFRTSVGGGFV